ncbi:hypothetical protein ACFQH6_14290 [Halobacteriaceae archaeon GCM10025711]
MVPVSYYCPRCGTLRTLDRDAYLSDKSVTPYPLAGWTYVAPEENVEAADGVRIGCTGCGTPFYLNYVRYEDGREVEGQPVPDAV